MFKYRKYNGNKMPSGGEFDFPSNKECLDACTKDTTCIGADIITKPDFKCFLQQAYTPLVKDKATTHYHLEPKCSSKGRKGCSFFAVANNWPIVRGGMMTLEKTAQECFKACMDALMPKCNGLGYVAPSTCYVFTGQSSWKDLEPGPPGIHGFEFKKCKTEPTLNECALGAHKCDENATCVDTVESYDCRCKRGYIGDGFTCDDYDECFHGVNNCHDKAVCTNTFGSFFCTCLEGFRGPAGTSCTDIDECVENTHNCSKQAICNNTMGSFTCACGPGYNGDGYECISKAINCEYEYKEYKQSKIPGGTWVDSVDEDDCVEKCDDTYRCFSADYNSDDHCFLITDYKEMESEKGVNHHRLQPNCTSNTKVGCKFLSYGDTWPSTKLGRYMYGTKVDRKDCLIACLDAESPACGGIGHYRGQCVHFEPDVSWALSDLVPGKKGMQAFSLIECDASFVEPPVATTAATNTTTELVPHPCDVTYRIYMDRKVYDGELVSSISSLSACQEGCNMDDGCTGADMDFDANTCWFDTQGSNVERTENGEHVNHYTKSLECGACSYEPYSGRSPRINGQIQSELKTEGECLMECSESTACRSVSFDEDTEQCQFYSRSYRSSLEPASEKVTYYDEFDCPTDCIDIYRESTTRRFSGNRQLVSVAKTLEACQRKCDAKLLCVAVDFRSDNNSCWLIEDIGDDSTEGDIDRDGEKHYVRAIRCGDCVYDSYDGRIPIKTGQKHDKYDSMAQCVQGCSQDTICKSAVFDRTTEICYFYYTTAEPGELEEFSSRSYYELYACGPACTSKYTKHPNSKLVRGVEHPASSTPAGCQDTCDSRRDQCVGWDWNRQQGSCWLGEVKPRGDVVGDMGEGVDSYQRTGYNCDVCSYTYIPGKEPTSEIGREFRDIADVMDCMAACSRMSACTAVNYYPTNKRCMFYTTQQPKLSTNADTDFLQKETCTT